VTDKKDVKSRLTRKRLRTSSAKNLNQETAPTSSEKDLAQGGTPSAPSLGTPSAQGMEGISAPGTQSSPGAVSTPGDQGAPVDAAPQPMEIDLNFGKKSSLTMVIIVALFALPSLGLGYCVGHRVEQNKLANTARTDAKDVLIDFENVADSLKAFSDVFSSPPGKLGEWLTMDTTLSIKTADLSLLGRAKINFIPAPKSRKKFIENIVEFHSKVESIQDEYKQFKKFIAGLEKQKTLIAAVDKDSKKIVGLKASEYFINLRTSLQKYTRKMKGLRTKAIVAEMKKEREKKKPAVKKGATFLLLMSGSTYTAEIIPVTPATKVCPEDKDGKKKEKCQEYEKVILRGPKGMKKAYKSSVDQKILFKDSFIYMPMTRIAARSMKNMIKYEIQYPLYYSFRVGIERFYRIRKLIQQAQQLASEIIPVLKTAKGRKKRGMI
jgi:hypothetical protein